MPNGMSLNLPSALNEACFWSLFLVQVWGAYVSSQWQTPDCRVFHESMLLRDLMEIPGLPQMYHLKVKKFILEPVMCESGHFESKSGSESTCFESESESIWIFLNPNPNPQQLWIRIRIRIQPPPPPPGITHSSQRYCIYYKLNGTVGNSNPIPNPGVNKFEAKSKSTVFLSDPNPNPADRYLDPDPNMDLANNQQMNDALVFI